MQLLEKTKLGKFELKNRIVMASMTRCRANADGTVSDMTSQYYQQRSSAGLIISEAINISEQAVGIPLTPGIYTSEQIQSWEKVTSAVHSAGGLIFAQLSHNGRVGHSIDKKGKLPVSAFASPITGKLHLTSFGMEHYEIPRALTLEEIKLVINDYQQAALNAMKAGFDGVELQCANGYLPNQFLVDSVNKRTDRYGGSIENRARFVLEVLQAMVNIFDAGKVGIKISPAKALNGIYDSNPKELYSYLIRRLNELPLAFLQMTRQVPSPDNLPYQVEDVLEIYGKLFHRASVIANGGYKRDTAEKEIESNRADLISFGTLFISNPDLPERFKLNAHLNSAVERTYYIGGRKGYTDYPMLETSQIKYEEAD